MTKRQTITDRIRIRSLFHHFGIDCYLCGERIVLEGVKHLPPFDHVVEVADDGEHTPVNLKPVHQSCHVHKSAKAETQRSRIDRLEKEKHGLPKRARKKRKIRSAPFPKVHRPMQSRAKPRKANHENANL